MKKLTKEQIKKFIEFADIELDPSRQNEPPAIADLENHFDELFEKFINAKHTKA